MADACAGERYQVHVQEGEANLYYSRRGIEHGTYSKYDILDPVIRAQLKEEGVILDGEIIVWNKVKCATPSIVPCNLSLLLQMILAAPQSPASASVWNYLKPAFSMHACVNLTSSMPACMAHVHGTALPFQEETSPRKTWCQRPWMLGCCRKIFEPFGGLKPAMHAARDDRDGEALLEMNGWEGDVMTSDPDYQTPQVKELEIVFVVWDVMYMRGAVRTVPHGTSLRARMGPACRCRPQWSRLSHATPIACMAHVQLCLCLDIQEGVPLRLSGMAHSWWHPRPRHPNLCLVVRMRRA